ncbi:MAG TPA: HEAT repeat domain-containing protein [Edaphobacter sp.]|nr:HEAT repeat domain-containing protein [Edaphobacter sp.]
MKTLIWYFALAAVLNPAALSAQNAPAAPSRSDQLATSIARAKSGNFDTGDVEIIAEAGAVQAIPSLEEQFERTTDVGTKIKIANGLVRLGDKHNTYWNYLLEQATLAVDSEVLDPLFSDAVGKTRDQLSSEIQAWAQAHNVSANTAVVSAVYDMPGKVLELAQTGDPRGIPFLRRALQSRNYMIAAWAAKGLAQIQDKDSIPLIIVACQRAPTGLRLWNCLGFNLVRRSTGTNRCRYLYVEGKRQNIPRCKGAGDGGFRLAKDKSGSLNTVAPLMGYGLP